MISSSITFINNILIRLMYLTINDPTINLLWIQIHSEVSVKIHQNSEIQKTILFRKQGSSSFLSIQLTLLKHQSIIVEKLIIVFTYMTRSLAFYLLFFLCCFYVVYVRSRGLFLDLGKGGENEIWK